MSLAISRPTGKTATTAVRGIPRSVDNRLGLRPSD